MSQSIIETRIFDNGAKVIPPTREQIIAAGGRISKRSSKRVETVNPNIIGCCSIYPTTYAKIKTPIDKLTKRASKRQAKQPVDPELQSLRDGLKAARIRNQNK